MQSLDDHLERLANADVLVRAYNCVHCKATESVVEKWDKGSLIGVCDKCKAMYLDPDWDAMGKELA
jgi:transcription elongation factor Elf1